MIDVYTSTVTTIICFMIVNKKTLLDEWLDDTRIFKKRVENYWRLNEHEKR